MKAFTRVSDSPITTKSYIYDPDVVVVTNDTLLGNPDILQGLGKESALIINTAKSAETLKGYCDCRLYPMNAIDLAYEILGRPIVNTLLFGAFIGVTDLFPLADALEIVREEFGKKVGELNVRAVTRGYEEVRKVI